MGRRNQDRMGGTQRPDSDPPLTARKPPGGGGDGGGGLTFVTPTEHVELPSRGLLYPAEHPLAGQTTLEIRHMTAKEEDILTSRSLLKNGIAIERMLSSIICDRRVTPGDMLVGDKNALLVAARIDAYGADYTTGVQCPSCGEKSQYTFDLNDAPIQAALDLDVCEDPDILERVSINDTTNNYVITLPKSGWSLEVRAMTGADEQAIQNSVKQRKKSKMPEATLSIQLRRMIVSVEGHTDASTINKAVDNLPASDSRYLRTLYQALMPNVDLKQNFACVHCDAEVEMEVPFTTDFFWPKS
tara:strand:+ start:6630 stop:7529 length:900 start_codon:yes stop_codon:yes gene_type:complete